MQERLELLGPAQVSGPRTWGHDPQQPAPSEGNLVIRSAGEARAASHTSCSLWPEVFGGGVGEPKGTAAV